VMARCALWFRLRALSPSPLNFLCHFSSLSITLSNHGSGSLEAGLLSVFEWWLKGGGAWTKRHLLFLSRGEIFGYASFPGRQVVPLWCLFGVSGGFVRGESCAVDAAVLRGWYGAEKNSERRSVETGFR
jgi:hypothetical protein